MGRRGRTAVGGRRLSRIAFLTPLAPEKTGIAEYSALVLAALAGRVEVDAYCRHPSPDPLPGVTIRPANARGLRRLESYDAVVAQIGNSAAHDWIVDWIRHRPAVVVLHELVLHHLVAHVTIGGRRPGDYIDALRRDGGANAVPHALAALTRRAEPLWELEPDRYPMAEFVTRHATGLIVHSDHMAEAVRARGLARDVTVAPLPARPVVDRTPIPPDPDRPVTFGVFGFINPNKRLPVVLAALRLALTRVPGLRLLVVGGSSSGIDPAGLAAEVGLPAAAVRVEAYSDRARYEDFLAQVDVGIALRHPTFGETSAVVVEFMARAIPVVVSTGGWYDELPDTAVARVAPDGDEVLTLAATIEHLARDPARRNAMGATAREYTCSVLDPHRSADAYIEALFGVEGRRGVEASLTQSLAGTIGEVGSVFMSPTAALATKVRAAAGAIGLLGRDGR